VHDRHDLIGADVTGAFGVVCQIDAILHVCAGREPGRA
jgi:hypothetical protein